MSERISEICWCPVNPRGSAQLPLVELQVADVVRNLNQSVMAWKRKGWRIAKLRIEEIPRGRVEGMIDGL